MSMLLPKNPRQPDRDYLDSYRDRPCDACGIQDGTTVPAHVRVGSGAGMSRKPHDWLVVALCFGCHADQEAHPGFRWWVENVLWRLLRERYDRWRAA